MTADQLTPAQRRVLAVLDDGPAHRGMRTDGRRRQVSAAAVRALESRGLVAVDDDGTVTAAAGDAAAADDGDGDDRRSDRRRGRRGGRPVVLARCG